MNYYPNYNSSNYYPNYISPYSMPNNISYGQNMQPQSTLSTLNGKIVDSEDVVKATEVPIGSYGIFPKADLSEIYIKSWNNNGTTNIVTFKPDASQNANILANNIKSAETESLDIIIEKITQLENKIDSVINVQQQQSAPQIEIKKEVSANAKSY